MSRIIWSTTLPTKPGYYWYRVDLDCDPSIVRVFRAEGDHELTIHYRNLDDDPTDEEAHVMWLSAYEGQFAGPIQLPKEPTE